MACPASTPSSQPSRPYLQEIPWSHAELSKSGFPHAAYLHRYMHVFRKIHWWTTGVRPTAFRSKVKVDNMAFVYQ